MRAGARTYRKDDKPRFWNLSGVRVSPVPEQTRLEQARLCLHEAGDVSAGFARMMGALAVVAAYLIGGIPFGLIVVKLMTGADVRDGGSGNIGATNVLRTTGRLAGVLTLILDAAKAWFAVWLADRLTRRQRFLDELRGAGGAARTRLSGVAALQGRKGGGELRGRVRLSDAGSAAGGGTDFRLRGGLDSLFVAGIDHRGGAVSSRLLDDPASHMAGACGGSGGGRSDH